jgi:hypothetical protein
MAISQIRDKFRSSGPSGLRVLVRAAMADYGAKELIPQR